MHTSRPIEIEGRFLGVAVTRPAEAQGAAWRFIATHPAVESLDGATFPNPDEARRAAGLALLRGSPPFGAAANER